MVFWEKKCYLTALPIPIWPWCIVTARTGRILKFLLAFDYTPSPFPMGLIQRVLTDCNCHLHYNCNGNYTEQHYHHLTFIECMIHESGRNCATEIACTKMIWYFCVSLSHISSHPWYLPFFSSSLQSSYN